MPTSFMYGDSKVNAGVIELVAGVVELVAHLHDEVPLVGELLAELLLLVVDPPDPNRDSEDHRSEKHADADADADPRAEIARCLVRAGGRRLAGSTCPGAPGKAWTSQAGTDSMRTGMKRWNTRHLVLGRVDRCRAIMTQRIDPHPVHSPAPLATLKDRRTSLKYWTSTSPLSSGIRRPYNCQSIH
ncbi:hypothetical protein CONLIGDRAFT_648130 [Coniochaeta ligniaria NRRL 30616]|uniref:Uncharacterized protein n=1 Tax=Coniochaeta ligniaria NRRL 30616 TaxID=1408157 RepID=A0A1J7IVE7_9PEZI|nr:hypothetical protein CONLIGDRAFT_648130 [Coniochaeta ligniaria NRRL 30616]